MKKTIILVSAVILFAGFSFAQTPQTQEKAKAPAKSECSKKNTKGCDDKKSTKCCSHSTDSKKAAEEKAPEKK